MTGARRLVVVSVVALGLTGGAGLALWNMYLVPRRALESDIARYVAGIEARQTEVEGGLANRRELDRFAGTTLGTSEEAVAAAVRTALNQIALANHLEDPSVSTRSAVTTPSPATRKAEDLGVRRAAPSPDFAVLPASFKGTGRMEDVLATLATLDAQDWVHQIRRVALTPTGPRRDLVELSVDLATVIVVGTSAIVERASREELWTRPDEGRLSAWQALGVTSRFRDPPPPPASMPVAAEEPVLPTPPAPAAPAPPTPGSRPEDWRVTGLVQGVEGWEVWLSASGTGSGPGGVQPRVLRLGEAVAGLRFVEGRADGAVFEREGSRTLARLHQTLDQREAASP